MLPYKGVMLLKFCGNHPDMTSDQQTDVSPCQFCAIIEHYPLLERYLHQQALKLDTDGVLALVRQFDFFIF